MCRMYLLRVCTFKSFKGKIQGSLLYIVCTAKYANHVYMGILCDHCSTLDSVISYAYAFNPP